MPDLFQHLLNKNLVSVYLPEIEVFHEEDSSTNAVFNNKPRKKEIFLITTSLYFLQIIVKIYNTLVSDYIAKINL